MSLCRGSVVSDMLVVSVVSATQIPLGRRRTGKVIAVQQKEPLVLPSLIDEDEPLSGSITGSADPRRAEPGSKVCWGGMAGRSPQGREGDGRDNRTPRTT
jgi:hypothetical protein